MKLNKDNKTRLINEIKFVLDKMKNEEEPKNKLYYFSAIYGVMQRIYNFESSPDLIFAHFVLSSTYAQINSRLKNPEGSIKIPEELFDKLISTTEELLTVIEQDKNPYEVLKKFTLLGYVTGGNGYYLYQRGLIKL